MQVFLYISTDFLGPFNDPNYLYPIMDKLSYPLSRMDEITNPFPNFNSYTVEVWE